MTADDFATVLDAKLVPIVNLVPMLQKLINRYYNPYRGGSSQGTRLKEFRTKLREAAYGNRTTPVKCMVTQISVGERYERKGSGRIGTNGNVTIETVTDEDIPAAHLLPSSTIADTADVLEMSLDDIQSTRNGLFLCKKIEESFDQLELSFVPVDILHPSQYKMVIWKDSCKTKSVIKGSLKLIGQYDEHSLELGGLEPYRRALSFQALLAYDTLSRSDENKLQQIKPEYFGTPPKSSDLDRILSLKFTTTHSEERTGTRNLGAILMTAIKEEGNKSGFSDDDC